MSRLTLQLWHASRQANALVMPTLMLLGEEDRVTDHRVTYQLYQKINPGLRHMVEFPTAFHDLLHDPMHPQVFAAMRHWVEHRIHG